jgi:AcrR family transcriptional regulator
MRVTKKHDIRQGEILDAAERLFVLKGYEATTVNDILKEVQIGKGTFYHYFKSKEDVMDGVVKRLVNQITDRSRAIANDTTLDAQAKMRQIIKSMNISQSPNGAILTELHKPANAQMHQKSIVETITATAPILAEVITQGIQEGVYNTPYPLETIEFLLVANQFIFDEGIFQWTPEEMATRATAIVRVTELSLGAPEGSFEFLLANPNESPST